ncbi:hypothetical protein BT69DRAFT_1277548 [Atractiella rhizophila]|nr:hypothetical protein BT69DRAFT_1284855 [Atractiella rhizophila]KAH8927996.1 hypothetical protein BT69DRAFT_1277548 [Atractiella rhizophila]
MEAMGSQIINVFIIRQRRVRGLYSGYGPSDAQLRNRPTHCASKLHIFSHLLIQAFCHSKINTVLSPT